MEGRRTQPWFPGTRVPTAGEVVELETVEHWWCRRCGRWEVCDDADLCIECRYMTGRSVNDVAVKRR